MSLERLRAVFGINIHRIVAILTRAQAMYDGMAADPSTYAKPLLPLPDFLVLIQNLAVAQQAVKTRTLGASEKRDVHRGLLITGMEIERAFVQSIADAHASQAAALITGAGLVVAASAMHSKPLLAVRHGKQSGSLLCDANVGLLVGAGAKHPNQSRYFNWQYTLDGGATFLTLPPTTTGKTQFHGLTPLTTVGVRVSMTNADGPGAWSQVVTSLVL